MHHHCYSQIHSFIHQHTFPKFVATEGALGLWVFAPLCGRNRGAFVLNPPDGHTYGCVHFPSNFAELAGVSYNNITDSNSIKEQFDGVCHRIHIDSEA